MTSDRREFLVAARFVVGDALAGYVLETKATDGGAMKESPA
jgi:hypothetical protein